MPVPDQGVSQARYSLIPRVLIFATRGDQILLLKGSPTKRNWPNLFNGIGGHIEQGEDILSAARREFHEETGLELKNPILCALVTIDTGGPTGIGMFVFRGEPGTGTIQNSPEGILEWVPQSNLASLPLVEDLPTLIPKVISFHSGDPILIAHSHYDEASHLKMMFFK